MSYNKLYLKITTIPQTEDLQTDSNEFRIYKDKYTDSREYTKDNDVLYSYYEDSAKHPSFGKIYSMTLGCTYEDKNIIKIVKGDEQALLTNLLNILKSDDFKSSELVCFNREFVLTFLTTRMAVNRISTVDLPIPLRHLGLKPWNLKQSKGMSEHYNGVGWFKINFNELCFNLGLPCNFMKGSDVYTFYKAGKIQELDENDTLYVHNLINADRISEDKEVIQGFDTYHQSLDGKVEEVEDTRPVLEKLHDCTDGIPENLKEELLETLKKKKATKKDKDNLYTILRGVYVKTDFENGDQDPKAVVESKEEEIKELIKQL